MMDRHEKKFSLEDMERFIRFFFGDSHRLKAQSYSKTGYSGERMECTDILLEQTGMFRTSRVIDESEGE
jgi:hypothetical protein